VTTLAFNSKRLLLLLIELRVTFNEVGRLINTHSRRGSGEINIVYTQN
jgi:hypothetical protein